MKTIISRTRKALKISIITAVIGDAIVLIMPFFSIPFHVPYPRWALTPMEYAIYMFFISVIVFVVGVPSAIIAIYRRGEGMAWLALLGCLGTWPLGVAAGYFVGFLFGVKITM
ncbi:MAG: hypothetical protein K8S27_06775 [Candidatus Omnitrophica bacterium]|nr:hypothetical protein [Candidatus Omnitrophota bacterium]